MIVLIVLDSAPLSLLEHPAARSDVVAWVARVLGEGHRLVIPEIADYEVRRKLLHLGRTASVARLDLLAQRYDYLALDTITMQMAAAFWACLRAAGQPTADPKELDGDVILAAQTQRLIDAAQPALVATSNVGHLDRLVPAQLWHTL